MKAATHNAQYVETPTDISIHAAREGGDGGGAYQWAAFLISIHAAREGGDEDEREALRQAITISIHAAREGGDTANRTAQCTDCDFNPRRP